MSSKTNSSELKSTRSGRKTAHDSVRRDPSIGDASGREGAIVAHTNRPLSTLPEKKKSGKEKFVPPSGDARVSEAASTSRYNTRSSAHINQTSSASSRPPANPASTSCGLGVVGVEDEGYCVSFPAEDVPARKGKPEPKESDDTADSSDVYNFRATSQDEDTAESSDAYDFRATSQTPPSDHCMAKDCFEEPLNQTAAQYAELKERRRLRQFELDLLMGTLAACNQDDVISVDDVKHFTENRLASLGVTKVTFHSTEDTVEVITEGIVTIDETFSKRELPSPDETVIFNGKVSPCAVNRTGIEEYPIKWNDDVLHQTPCQLCSDNDSAYQFNARHRKTNLKHILAHSYEIPSTGEDSGRLLETTFSIETALQSSNFNRLNFLPTTTSLEEAVEMIREDDQIPSSLLLDPYNVILTGLQCITALNIHKLLRFYYCMVNANYGVRGRTIRQVQMCSKDLPADFLS